MENTVKILPSGKEFDTHPHETLLDSALRAGLNMNYSCNNGSCGECKAKLISGEIEKVRYHDYVITEAEKCNGNFLMCSSAGSSDLVIETGTAGGVEDIPVQQITATVNKIERVTDDVLVMHVRTPRSKTLRFLAGQHVSLEMKNQLVRNKSIASCPCNAMNLQFHVRRVDGDPFSDYVFTELRTSEKIDLNGPWGVFTLDEDSPRPIVFLAYESGFAPIKSIVEHLIALEASQPIHLYWLANGNDGHYMDNFCRAWVDAFDDFKYSRLFGHDGPHDPELSKQHLAEAGSLIVSDYPDLSGHDIYLCGPDSIMDDLVEKLQAHGASDERLYIDALRRF